MKMKKIAVACSAALMGLSTLGMSSAASAEDMGLEFSANVALTTDYVWRGFSQNNEDPAIQGGFDVAHSSGVYAGIWASNVDYNGSTIETDYYIGWAGETGPVSLDVGYIWYVYPGQDPNTTDVDFEEFYVGVSKDFDVFEAGLSFSYDDDNDADYWDLSGSVPVGDFSIAAHYGWYNFDNAADYEDWSIGASTELGGFGFDLTYTDTDVDNDPTADDRVIFTVSKSL